MSHRVTSLLLLISFIPIIHAEPPANLRLDANGFPLPEGALRRLGDIRFCQPGTINALAITADGQRIASAGSGVFLWNANTGRIIHQLDNKMFVLTVSFSRDGTMVAGASQTGEVKLWDVRSGKLRWSVPGSDHNNVITSLRFIDNDRILAGAFESVRVELWNVDDGKSIRSCKLESLAKESETSAVSLSPSGERTAWLIAPAWRAKGKEPESRVLVYDTLTGKKIHELGIKMRAADLHLLDEGRTIFFQGGESGFAHNFADNFVIDLANGQTRFRFPYDKERYASQEIGRKAVTAELLSVSPDAQWLVSRDHAKTTAWHIPSGKSVPLGEDCFAATFSADGKRRLVARDSRLHYCNEEFQIFGSPYEMVTPPQVRYLDDGRLIAEGHRLVAHWNPGLKGVTRVFLRNSIPRNAHNIYALGTLGSLFPYHSGSHIEVIDLSNNRLHCRLEGAHTRGHKYNWVYLPELSTDETRVLVFSAEGDDLLVQWFDSTTGREIGRHRVSSADLFPKQFRPVHWFADDGSEFGYINGSGRVTLVDCKSGKARISVGFSTAPPDPSDPRPVPTWGYQAEAGGKFILAQRIDKLDDVNAEIAVWDRATGRLVRHFHCRLRDPNVSSGTEYALSYDGRLVASQIRDQPEMILIDTVTGTWRGRMRAPNAMNSLSFAPDNRTLATGCSDTSVLIWDLNRPWNGLPALKSDTDPEELWKMLGERDAAQADRAIWALVQNPNRAVAMLGKYLAPAVGPDRKQVRNLVEQLGSGDFKTRQSASEKLKQLGEPAISELTAVLKSESLEQVRRAMKILEYLQNQGTITSRPAVLRAIEGLERIDNSEARQLLQSLAAGDGDAHQTWEARFALQRLQRGR